MDVSPVAQAESVSGKTSPKELLFLMSLAQDAPAGTAVEVGALHGRSVLAWSTKRRGRGEMLVVDDLCRDTLKRNLPEIRMPVCSWGWECFGTSEPLSILNRLIKVFSPCTRVDSSTPSTSCRDSTVSFLRNMSSLLFNQ